MRLPFATFTVSFLALSGAVAQQWQPQLVARDESGDRNIPNFRFDWRHTSGGHFQISDTNWRAEAPVLGIDLRVYPNAISAPEQLQGQVAGRMWAKYGYMPWVCCNARLRQHLRANVAEAAQQRTAIPTVQAAPPVPEVTHPNPFARPTRTPREFVSTGG